MRGARRRVSAGRVCLVLLQMRAAMKTATNHKVHELKERQRAPLATPTDLSGVAVREAARALMVPGGEGHRHKHHATIATTRLFLVEDA